MKKISLLLILVLGLSLSTKSFADGELKKSKQNKTLSSLQVIIEDLTVKLSFDLFKKSTYKVVLFSEDGEYLEILDEGKHKADFYSYNLDKRKLPQGKYICLFESKEVVVTEFFEIKKRIPNQIIQLDLDSKTQHINITCNKKDSDYTIHVFKEDGTFYKTIDIKSQLNSGEISINTAEWGSGEYFIHIESNTSIYSKTIQL